MSIALIGGAVELFDALPETDAQACDAAVARGDYINASFNCPALHFFKSIFSGPPDDDDDDDDEGDY